MCSLVNHAEQALFHSVFHAALVQLNSRFNHFDFFWSILVNLNECSHRQGVIRSILSFQCFSLGYHSCRLLSLTFPAAFPTSIISIIWPHPVRLFDFLGFSFEIWTLKWISIITISSLSILYICEHLFGMVVHIDAVVLHEDFGWLAAPAQKLGLDGVHFEDSHKVLGHSQIVFFLLDLLGWLVYRQAVVDWLRLGLGNHLSLLAQELFSRQLKQSFWHSIL